MPAFPRKGILHQCKLKGGRKFALRLHGGEQTFRHALGTAHSNCGILRLGNSIADIASYGMVKAVKPAPQ
jgi:hypothetical protein